MAAGRTYRIFTRNWWKINPAWPKGLEPDGGARKHTIGYAADEDEARAICKAWNDSHKPGKLARRAEYTSDH